MISVEKAATHAIFHLASIADGVQPSFGASEIQNGSIGNCAAFYDLEYGKDQDPIIYLFEVLGPGNNHAGEIAINASPNIGRTFAFLQLAKGRVLSDLVKRGENLLVAKGFQETLSVVYSYPKLGILGRSGTNRLIVDLFTGETFEPNGADPLEVQGRVTWSFWDDLPQAGDPPARWQAEDSFISSFAPPSVFTFSPVGASYFLNNSPAKDAEKIQAILRDIRTQMANNPPVTDTFVLPTKKIGQENAVYCACASLQIIYQFVFEKELAQEQIALAMETASGGSTITGQIKAYRKFFNPKFDILLDRKPSVQTLRESLLAYLPLKSGIAGHARVAAGYRRDLYADPITGQARLISELLLVIDPEPISTGTIRWDAFDPAALKDFILLKRLPELEV